MTRQIKAYAWAVVKNNEIDPLEIYADKDVVLGKGEKLVRVIICEENKTKKNK